MNTVKSKFIFVTFLGWSGLTILLSAFFLTLFGVVDLKVIKDLNTITLLNNFIKFGLYYLNCLTLFKLSLNYNKIKTAVISFAYMPVYILTNIISLQFLQPIILILFVFVLSIKEIKLKNLLKCIVFLIIISVYQLLSNYIKLGLNIFDITSSNYLEAFIYSIDLFCFYGYLIYINKKAVSNYVGLELEHNVFSKGKSVFSNKSTSKETLETCDLTARQKAFFALMVMGYQVMQLLVVLAIGALNNMFVELLVMLPMFWIGRKILQQSWHSNKLWICSVATFSGFYILTKITPPFEISLFLIVALTGTFVYLLHVLGVKADRLETLEEQEEKRKMLTVKNLTNVMADCHTPQKYHDYLIRTICNGIKDTDYFADESVRKLNIDEQQYRNHKTKFKKELKRRKML